MRWNLQKRSTALSLLTLQMVTTTLPAQAVPASSACPTWQLEQGKKLIQNPTTQAQAAHLLSHCGTAAVPILRQALQLPPDSTSTDPTIALLKALTQIGKSATAATPEITIALNTPALQDEAIETATSLSSPTLLPPLLQLLQNKDLLIDRRIKVAKAIGSTRPLTPATKAIVRQTLLEMRSPLRESLQDQPEKIDTLIHLTEALDLIGESQEATTTVLDLLQNLPKTYRKNGLYEDSEPGLQRHTASLTAIGSQSPKYIALLSNLLKNSRNTAIRIDAAFLLTALKEKATPAVPALTQILTTETNPHLLINASLALLTTQSNTKKIPPAIGIALKNLTPKQAQPETRDRLLFILDRLKPQMSELTPTILEALQQDPTQQLHPFLLATLATLGPSAKAALPHLQKIATRKNDLDRADTKSEAIKAAIKIGADIPFLKNVITRNDRDRVKDLDIVKLHAIGSLANQGEQNFAVSALLQLCTQKQDPKTSPAFWQTAAQVFNQMGSQALPIVLPKLETANTNQRQIILFVLSQIDNLPPKIINQLTTLSNDEKEPLEPNRRLAAYALERNGSDLSSFYNQHSLVAVKQAQCEIPPDALSPDRDLFIDYSGECTKVPTERSGGIALFEAIKKFLFPNPGKKR